MEYFYDKDKVDNKKLIEKLNKSLYKKSKTMIEMIFENEQKKARSKEIMLRTQTDDDFSFYNRINNLSFYCADKIIKERYKLDKSPVAKEKAISMELSLLKNRKKKQNNSDTYYEYILSLYDRLISENSIDEAVVLALLDKEINIHYQTQNTFGLPIRLDSLLCGHQHNKKVIKKLLTKDLSLYFSNGLSIISDLCQLSVEGGNLEKALEVFNDERYTGFSESILQELRRNSGAQVFDDKFNCTPLSNIISKLSKNDNTKEEKKAFLNNVLYGGKVKMLDVISLKDIATIYSDEEYIGYLDYMKHQMEEDNLVVYSTADSDKDLLFFRELVDDAYNKGVSYRKVNAKH